ELSGTGPVRRAGLGLSRGRPEGEAKLLLDSLWEDWFVSSSSQVLVYMATEGPAKLKHGKTKAHDYDARTDTAPSVDRWVAYVKKEYGDSDEATLKKAYAQIIVKEYAERYGEKIGGWWFDHAAFGDMDLLRGVCREANPECVLTFNRGTLPSLSNENPGYEDYVCGHPNPCRLVPPSDAANLPMVEAAEGSRGGFVYADDADGVPQPEPVSPLHADVRDVVRGRRRRLDGGTGRGVDVARPGRGRRVDLEHAAGRRGERAAGGCR
ncbi:hypothetical protein THAOC_13792, partial [Thalassiosira oceanica]